MRLFNKLKAVLALVAIAMSVSLVAVDHAEARRGGSFGSRGVRTYSKPAQTNTAPRATDPVQRSMTPRQQNGTSQAAGTRAAGQQGQRGGMFGGLAGGLLGGLMLGGLIGMFMGNGLGGMAGFLGLILQVGLAILVVTLIMRWFRSRQQPAYAGASQQRGPQPQPQPQDMRNNAYEAAPQAAPHAGAHAAPMGDAGMAPSGGGDEIGLTEGDYDSFEQLLAEVQAAFSREDYAQLRTRCTPEIVSFLSEELSQNAVNGLKNDVTDVKLLEGDLAEAWREGDSEYATVALRYESVDVMRDRQTGEIKAGDERPTETTELWTFVRPVGGQWQLSAIQES